MNIKGKNRKKVYDDKVISTPVITQTKKFDWGPAVTGIVYEVEIFRIGKNTRNHVLHSN
jgi:hypothetical protein